MDEFLFKKIEEVNIGNIGFQQDDVTSHMANARLEFKISYVNLK